MLEKLKSLAMQKLMQKMAGNSLSEAATGEAAQEGANALMETIKGGDMSKIMALFSGGAAAGEGNEVVSNVKGKIQEILQAKGMSAEEAKTESESTAQDLIAGVKEKFQSTSEEDSAFDLSKITGLLGGDAGDLLNKAKNLF
jgi:hypothetical protein